MAIRHAVAVGLVLGTATATATAQAETLRVGPGERYAKPSAAIAAAAPGDTVLIAPGDYYDCVVIQTPRLTIAGDADGAVLTDATCQGKAILVIPGSDITIRNLTLQRARVADQNGAGIRAQGRNLTIEHVAFVNNQDGLLAAAAPDSTIRIRDSMFERNGHCSETRCGNALTVGALALLSVEDTQFREQRQGHDIESNAARTELLGDEFSDGPAGVSGAFVALPQGGDLRVQDSRFEIGPNTSSPRAAILLGAVDGGPADARQTVTHSILVGGGAAATLVLNWGNAAPSVAENTVPPGMTTLSTHGALWNRTHAQLYAIKTMLGKVAGLAKRAVAKVLSKV